jgi:hypothetical protein
MLNIVLHSVVMLRVIYLSVVRLIYNMTSAIMQNVIELSVIGLSVVTPILDLSSCIIEVVNPQKLSQSEGQNKLECLSLASSFGLV